MPQMTGRMLEQRLADLRRFDNEPMSPVEQAHHDLLKDILEQLIDASWRGKL